MAKSTGYVLKERAYIGSVTPPATFEDESRFGNDGTHTNITWVQLPSGLWERQFNGTSSLITFPSGFADLTNITLLMWAYWTGDGEEWIFSNGTSEAAGTMLAFRNTQRMRHLYNYDGDYYLVDTATNTTPKNQWNLVGYTFTVATTTLSVYINGLFIDSDNTGTAVARSLTTPLMGRQAWAAAGYFGGSVALPGIWNYALSAGKIKQIFEAERHWYGV